jgi:hypothetical protein
MISTRIALSVVAATLASVSADAAVMISTAATQNMNCSGGTCVPTAKKAVLNATDLENDLSQYGNVVVMTTGNGVEANNIVVNAGFSSPDSTSLTLDAHDAITVNAVVSLGTGTAELELQSDTLGDVLLFGRKGHITFGSTSDIFGINGGIFTLVSSVQSLAAAVVANPGGAYALANSYDASQDGTYTNCPIDEVGGTIEGLGNTVSNLSIDTKRKNAAFVNSLYGTIENVRLAGILYRTTKDTGAGLVIDNHGSLFGDETQGSIWTRKGDVGGLVGYNFGTIVSSSARVQLKGKVVVAGGLAVENLGTISKSNARGSVSGAVVGGLVAYNYKAIDQSFSTSRVKGSEQAGGFVAYLYGDSYPAPVISNSYATGTVEITNSQVQVGGFVDVVETNVGGNIEYSYSTGSVGATNGGFGCYTTNAATITDDYWDTDTSGTNDGVCGGNLSGITGLTTQQLQSGLPTGFDPKIWAEKPNINNGFPYLINNPPP